MLPRFLFKLFRSGMSTHLLWEKSSRQYAEGNREKKAKILFNKRKKLLGLHHSGHIPSTHNFVAVPPLRCSFGAPKSD